MRARFGSTGAGLCLLLAPLLAGCDNETRGAALGDTARLSVVAQCRAALARVRRSTLPAQAQRHLVEGCGELLTKTECRQAWDAPHVELSTRPANLLRACARAYCPVLDQPKPKVCLEGGKVHGPPSALREQWAELFPRIVKYEARSDGEALWSTWQRSVQHLAPTAKPRSALPSSATVPAGCRLSGPTSADADLRGAPTIALKGNRVSVDGNLVDEVAAATKVVRIEGLLRSLKQRRSRWRGALPTEPFPGIAVLHVQRNVPAALVKSCVQTAALAGYSKVSFVVCEVADEVESE